MSAYTIQKIKDDYTTIGKFKFIFTHSNTIDVFITYMLENSVSIVTSFLQNYPEYSLTKIPKNSVMVNAGSLAGYNIQKNIKDIDYNPLLKIDNTDIYELTFKLNTGRKGSLSTSYNNNFNYSFIPPVSNPYSISVNNQYLGFTDKSLSRFIIFRNDEDFYALNILLTNITKQDLQNNLTLIYSKRKLFLARVFIHIANKSKFVVKPDNTVFTDADAPSFEWLMLWQKICYGLFEQYRYKRQSSDPQINGLLINDMNVDPLFYKDNTNVIALPGVEFLIFAPELETNLHIESIYYLKDKVFYFDKTLWENELKNRILPNLQKEPTIYKNYNFKQYEKINNILNSYVRGCRYLAQTNDIYSPIDELKNVKIYADTECSCYIVNDLGTNTNKKQYFVQENIRPLLTNIAAKGLYDTYTQAKAYVTQEICLRNSSIKYMIPKKPNNIIRIMSYNIHFWQEPRKEEKFINNQDLIIDVIRNIDPDIILFQEVEFMSIANKINVDWKMARQNLQQLGYIVEYKCAADHPAFGNMIVYKSSLNITNFSHIAYLHKKLDGSDDGTNRCMIKGDVTINNKNYSIYSIHLDVKSEEARKAFTDIISQELNKNKNLKILAGDFNSTRDEYPFKKLLTSNNMTDSYTKLNITPPIYTTWTGTEIDFIFLDNNIPNKDIMGTYVVHTPASDHLPIFVDIKANNDIVDYKEFVFFDESNYELNNFILPINKDELISYKAEKPLDPGWWAPQIQMDRTNFNRKEQQSNNINLPLKSELSVSLILNRIDDYKLANMRKILSNPSYSKLIDKDKLKRISTI